MPPVATAAVAIAIGLDLLIGEFPERIHPVVWYGRLIDAVDQSWAHPRIIGTIAAVLIPVGAAGISTLLVWSTLRIHLAIGVGVAGCLLFSVTSLRRLITTAGAVIALSESDLAAARERLPALVGRDPSTLSPGGIRSAAVESTAENLSDGLVAPLLGFGLLAWWSLPAAVGVAVWVKAVNTGDSMLGYRTKPVGWASAKLDDLVMWLPARTSAGLLAVSGLDPLAVRRARRWVRDPPSPNAGWPMATLAELLGVRLVKPGVYVLGDGDLPTPALAQRGVRIVGIAGGLAFLGTGVAAWF